MHNGSITQVVCVLGHFSHVQFLVAPWTVPPGFSVHGISQAGIVNRLPFPSPGDLPNLGIELHLLCLLHWQVASLPLVPPGKPNIR